MVTQVKSVISGCLLCQRNMHLKYLHMQILFEVNNKSGNFGNSVVDELVKSEIILFLYLCIYSAYNAKKFRYHFF